MKKRPFIPTQHKLRESVRRIAGTDLHRLSGHERPSDKDLEKGTEKALVEKIFLKEYSEDGWEVTTISGRRERVEISSDLGVEWLPDGKIVNNILYPEEEVWVEIIPDAFGEGYRILSSNIKKRKVPEPGSTTIIRGNSMIKIHKDRIEINTPKLILNGDEYNG